MNYIPAPWRAQLFNTPPSQDSCIFCSLPARNQFEEDQILFCDDHVFVIINRYPYNSGHLMVIPRQHVKNPIELEDASYQALTKKLKSATQIVQEALQCHGINIGMNIGKAAGAGIEEHCHFHVVPRWAGDTNFMPVLAETKVINEHFDSIYVKLRPFFRE